MPTLALPFRRLSNESFPPANQNTYHALNLHATRWRDTKAIDGIFDHIQAQQPTRLNLSGLKLQEKIKLPDILKKLSMINPLVSLNLSKNHLGDRHVHLLCETLKESHPNLERLNLNANNITDQSIQTIIQLFKNHPSLTELTLSGNQITDTGIQELIDYLKKSERYISITIENNPISTERKAEIDSEIKQNLLPFLIAIMLEKLGQDKTNEIFIAFVDNLLLLEKDITKTNPFSLNEEMIIEILLQILHLLHTKYQNQPFFQKTLQHLAKKTSELIAEKKEYLVNILLTLPIIRETFKFAVYDYSTKARSAGLLKLAGFFDELINSKAHAYFQGSLDLTYQGKQPHKTVILREGPVHLTLLQKVRAIESKMTPKKEETRPNYVNGAISFIITDRKHNPSGSHGRTSITLPIEFNDDNQCLHVEDFYNLDAQLFLSTIKHLLPVADHSKIETLYEQNPDQFRRLFHHSERALFAFCMQLNFIEKTIHTLKESEQLKLSKNDNTHGHKVYAIVLELYSTHLLCDFCHSSMLRFTHPQGEWLTQFATALEQNGFVLPKSGTLASAVRVTAEKHCKDSLSLMLNTEEPTTNLNHQEKITTSNLLQKFHTAPRNHGTFFSNLSKISRQKKLTSVKNDTPSLKLY